MIHFSLLSSRLRATASPAGLEPLTPAAYLRLRRKAAGMSIEQVVARITPDLKHRADARTLITMLEDDGTKARRRETLDWLEGAFPFDGNVYVQLATEPADRHPQVCRGCGCSHWDPCVASDGLTHCTWAVPNNLQEHCA